jgi:hypothetical protein
MSISNETRSFYTPKGLKKLAEIVRAARGMRSYREFEAITGVSHGVIRRIEILDAKMPDQRTLSKLAPHTPFSAIQLQTIAMQQEEILEDVDKQYWRAEDVMSVIDNLPDEEIARLAKLLIDRLLVQKSPT